MLVTGWVERRFAPLTEESSKENVIVKYVAVRLLTGVTAGATLLLILVGSLVTSTGSGLAVPDWPLSYGTLFPPMVGGILYEHSHRLVAAAVGLLVVVQALVFIWREPRGWLRVLAWVAVAAIVLQGGLGGLTVLLLLPTPISVTHAVLAQSLFLLLVFIAYTHSREWQRRAGEQQATAVRASVAVLPALVFLQLLLGALMRHTESGLAIPDFPLMGGRLVPRFDEQMLATINATRFQLLLEPVVTGQVVIHFLHRLGAAATLAAVVAANLDLRRRPAYGGARRLLAGINGLVLVQVTLGALTVLTVRLPLVASLHVFVGAALLAVTLLCLLRCVPVPAGAARAAGVGSGTVAQERPARAGPVRRAIAHHS